MRRSALFLLAMLAAAPAGAQTKADEKQKREQAAALVQRLKTLGKDPDAIVAKLVEAARAKKRGSLEEGEGSLTKDQLRRQVLRHERKRVRKALHGLGRYAEGPLLAAWKGLPEDDSVYALVLLTRMARPSGLEALVQASKSDHLYHRRLAAGYLPELKALDRRAVVRAELRLLKDRDGQVLQGVLGALRALAPQEAWRPLLSFLKDSLVAQDLANDGRIGAAIRALGAIFSRHPDLTYVDQVLETSGAVAGDTEDPVRGARVVDVFEAAGSDLASPYLRSILEQVYQPGETPEQPLDELDNLRPFPAELRSSAIRALGVIHDQQSAWLMAKALHDTYRQPRRDAMSAISQIKPRGAARKEIFRAALKLLVDSDRVLRRLTHQWLERTTGVNLPLNYTRWRHWLETDYVRVQVLEILALHAKSSGFDSLRSYFVAEGAPNLDAWLQANDYKDSADFLQSSELVPQNWPPEDYGAIPEAELLKRYEEDE